MPTLTKYPEPLVFGLDIGTRSIVGTVGYREGKQFNIVAQAVRFHDTRAMLDGQIHDINKIGEEITEVKDRLQEQLPGRKLKEVCIAAAGRVLKTSIGKGFYEFPELTAVNQEFIHSIELMGVEEAHEKMMENNESTDKFFCVGYSVIKYYLNDYVIGNLEGQKAHSIGADILATFLPEEVVDSLYAAVEMAGLEVANMTLEPIAAIQVAIPENYRLLNIALIDVGAGTSDISITKDGSIVGYGMLPKAGDELTETLIKEYLVDFDTAERIKMIGAAKKTLTYKDILSVPHKVTSDEVYSKIDSVLEDITEQTAKRIIELNGDKPVAAAFVVGGGGKVPGYTDKLAKHLGIPAERVGLRGEEVLGDVNILVEDVKKDPLLVTPIGICLNFYDQKNRFIYLTVNGERVKLYDNDKLTVFDAVVAFGLSNDDVFPKRGDDLNYTLNGKKRFIRGNSGEPAEIKLNDLEVGMNHLIQAGDKIEITKSTKGNSAQARLEEVVDLSAAIKFIVNDMEIICPRYATVNGSLESGSYELNDGDVIDVLGYYTLTQLMQFMDIETPHEVFVNGARANADTKIYENFNVAWIDHEDIYKAERFVTEDDEDEYDDEEDDEDVMDDGSSNEESSDDIASDNKTIDGDGADGDKSIYQASDNEVADGEESEDDKPDDEAAEEDNSKASNDTSVDPFKSEGGEASVNLDSGGLVSVVFGPDDISLDDSASEVSDNKADTKKDNKTKKTGKNRKKKKPTSDDGYVQEELIFDKKPHDLHVMVNNKPITLTGKADYVFIDIFDKYDFDLKNVGGTRLVEKINGENAGHFAELSEGSVIELYWEK
ncbi:MAG: rod shape-determining protein [Lachnospiraceae bacterium]|nr:rod shape-determining protein [Lachnospiraceae bacterium]